MAGKATRAFRCKRTYFSQKEGKAVVWDGWKVGGMDSADGVVKGKGDEADGDKVTGCP